MIFSHKSDQAAKERVRETETEWFSCGSTLAQTSVEKPGKLIVSIHLDESGCSHLRSWMQRNPHLLSTSHSVTPPPLFLHSPSPFLSLSFSLPLRMINAPCPISVPVAPLTRLLFYHRESDVAAFHGHLDAFHKSCKAEVDCRGSRAPCVTDQERTVTQKPHLVWREI